MPAPSMLDGARWWNGRDFDGAARRIAEGRIHGPRGPISERVALPRLFAIPLSPGDCDRRPVVPRVAFPATIALVEGAAADFYLSPADPRDGASPPVAVVCGGQLVD